MAQKPNRASRINRRHGPKTPRVVGASWAGVMTSSSSYGLAKDTQTSSLPEPSSRGKAFSSSSHSSSTLKRAQHYLQRGQGSEGRVNECEISTHASP